MNDSIKRITLDVQQAHSKEIVYVKKTDTGRKLIIYLVDGSLPYHITSECQAIFTATRPGTTTPVVNTCAIDGCSINYTIDPLITEITGRISCEIVIYGADGKRLTAARFTIICEGIIYETGEDAETPLTKPMSILLAPENAKVGQFFQIKEVGADGRSVLLEAVDKPTIDPAVLSGKLNSGGDLIGISRENGQVFFWFDELSGVENNVFAIPAKTVLAIPDVPEKSTLKIQIFGDSISSETWGDKATWVSKLPALLPEYVLDIKNSARGGNTLIHWVNDSLNKGVAWQVGLDAPAAGVQETGGSDQYDPVDSTADLIVVFAGTNDWGGTGFAGLIGEKTELFQSWAVLQGTSIAGLGIGNTSKIVDVGSGSYSLTWYPVQGGKTYHLKGTEVKYQIAWPLGIFTTTQPAKDVTGTVIVADDGSQTLLNSQNELTDYDFEFTPPQDGYIAIARAFNYNTLTVSELSSEYINTGCIYGAVRKIVEAVAEKNPMAKLIFLTPMQRYNSEDAGRDVNPETGKPINSAGYDLLDVTDAIVDACAYFAVPCIDMYRCSGFNRHNYNYLESEYTEDGLHPNEVGDQRIAQIVANAIIDPPKTAKGAVPTKTSQLNNDSGFQTAEQVIDAINASLAKIPIAEGEGF